jgi:pimeloyl-ACP methyl ester carboxylesterase
MPKLSQIWCSAMRCGAASLVAASLFAGNAVAAAQESPPVSSLEVDGVELAYVERGQGEPVIFVHGTLTDYRLWTPQMEPFAEQYRAIAYSRRYHYPNASLGQVGDGADYSFALHAEDLAGLIQRLGLGPVHVVGHSTGAIVALLLARQHPELVRTLVLGEPGVRSLLTQSPDDQALAAEELATTIRPAQDALQRDDLEGGARAFVDGRNARPGAFDQLPPAARANQLANAPALKAELVLGPGLPSFTCQDAHQISAPTLLLTGERSLRFFDRIAEVLEGCLPDAQRAEIPGAPHGGIFSANPQVANDAVLAFLARRPPPAAQRPPVQLP